MKILEINILGFGHHKNLNITMSEGVNVLLGDNESGKSTISAFIYTMLYGFEDENKRLIYRPWDNSAQFGGNILLECDDNVFKIDAIFNNCKEEDIITLYNITSDSKIDIPVGQSIGEILLNVSSDAFRLSSYSDQLSGKPNINDANIDYLYDSLMKKNEEAMQTSDEITVGKRLNKAIEEVGSFENNTGILGELKKEKSHLEKNLNDLQSIKTELNEKRTELAILEKELHDKKNQHSSQKTDMSIVTKAVETATLHGDVKTYVNKINKLDDKLSEAVKKSKTIRKPIDIAYAIIMVLCFVIFFAVFFAEKFSSIPLPQAVYEKMLELSSELSSYVILFTIAAFVSIWNMVLTYIFNKPVRYLTDELNDTEEELFDLLNVEYFPGVKNRQYNRDNINTALTKHKVAYKQARTILENEDNKTKLYNEHLQLVEKYTQKISYIKASIESLEKNISDYANEDTILYMLNENTKNTEKYIKSKAALTIAKETIEEAFQQWQTDLGPKYIKEANNIMQNLTGGKYSEMKIAKNFDISLMSKDGVMHSYKNYSSATVDQMYLSLRLSLVKMLSSKGNMLPVIFDDSFIQYDSKRRNQAYDIIKNYSFENSVQIILTACTIDKFPDEFNIINLEK